MGWFSDDTNDSSSQTPPEEVEGDNALGGVLAALFFGFMLLAYFSKPLANVAQNLKGHVSDSSNENAGNSPAPLPTYAAATQPSQPGNGRGAG